MRPLSSEGRCVGPRVVDRILARSVLLRHAHRPSTLVATPKGGHQEKINALTQGRSISAQNHDPTALLVPPGDELVEVDAARGDSAAVISTVPDQLMIPGRQLRRQDAPYLTAG